MMYISIVWGEVKTATFLIFPGVGMVTDLPIISVMVRVVGAGVLLAPARAAVVTAGACWVVSEATAAVLGEVVVVLLEQPGSRPAIAIAIIIEITRIAFFVICFLLKMGNLVFGSSLVEV